MHESYDDIISRIAEPPQWWDANGVPRYSKPHPSRCPNIYARKVAFLTIACQHCRREFLVQLHEGPYDAARGLPPLEQRLTYGDPPNAGCCPSGATMSSVPVRVEAWWTRERGDWQLASAEDTPQVSELGWWNAFCDACDADRETCDEARASAGACCEQCTHPHPAVEDRGAAKAPADAGHRLHAICECLHADIVDPATGLGGPVCHEAEVDGWQLLISVSDFGNLLASMRKPGDIRGFEHVGDQTPSGWVSAYRNTTDDDLFVLADLAERAQWHDRIHRPWRDAQEPRRQPSCCEEPIWRTGILGTNPHAVWCATCGEEWALDSEREPTEPTP